MRRVKIVIPILKKCLVNNDRFKRHILCLELKTVEKCDVLERVHEVARDEIYSKKIWKDEHRKLYIAPNVDASWETVKRICLYSRNTAFIQHKHDKNSLQTETPQPADKKYFRKARETPGVNQDCTCALS